jgi:hypothetical protein
MPEEEGLLRFGRAALADPSAGRLLIEKSPGVDERIAEAFGAAS